MKTYNTFHIRRSGGHAIIEWMASGFNHTKHYNDCNAWMSKTKRWAEKDYGDESQKIDCTIFSYEDFEPSEEEIQKEGTIVFIRDWYNMCASRIVSKRNMAARSRYEFGRSNVAENVYEKYIDLYYKYPHKFINYNLWIVDESYRQLIASMLDLGSPTFTMDLPLSKIGGGSSFKGEVNQHKLLTRYEDLTAEQINEISHNVKINNFCKEIFNISL